MIKRQVLCADEGKVLTDGAIYGKVIYLAEGADASAFWEIPEEEYEAMMAEPEVT